jgi:hypothetical protein
MFRGSIILTIFCCLLAVSMEAVPARVMKVLPQFLDTNGVHTLSPSLYERDAYQAYLREHPELRSGIRFDVQWKTKPPVFGKLKLRLELRGIAAGDLPRQLTLEQPVEPTLWFSHWTAVPLTGAQYRDFGEVTAWRVSLWAEDGLVAEQKSFLW